MMQAPSSRIPPVRAAAVASDLYKPCACLPVQYASGAGICQFLWWLNSRAAAAQVGYPASRDFSA